MPELPEVETVRRGLEPHLVGQTLRDVVLARPDLRFPFPEGFADRLRGAQVTSLTRRGKYLRLETDRTPCLSGCISECPAGSSWIRPGQGSYPASMSTRPAG